MSRYCKHGADPRDCHECPSQRTVQVPSDAAAGSARLLAALLKPTIDMMREAGISRMACGREKSFVLQMESGEVITIDPPNAKCAGTDASEKTL